MRSEKYLWKICMEIYREMYKEAEPSADINKMIESGESEREGFFMDYYLSDEKEVEIVEKTMKKYKCNKRERRNIRLTIYLGSAPSSVRKKK